MQLIMTARKAVLLAVVLASFAAAVLMQFSDVGVRDLGRADVPELAAILGLLVLPVATLAALQLERRRSHR